MSRCTNQEKATGTCWLIRCGGRNLLLHMRRKDGDDLFFFKRHPARRQMIQNGTQRIHVGLGVERVGALGLLGREKAGRADDVVAVHRGGVRAVASHNGQAEIGDLRHAARIQPDRGALEVAVDDVRARPHLVEAGDEGRGDTQNLLQRQGPECVDLFRQRRAVDVFHDDVMQVVLADDVEYGGDRIALDACEESGRREEMIDFGGILRDLGFQSLYDDHSVERRLNGFPEDRAAGVIQPFDQTKTVLLYALRVHSCFVQSQKTISKAHTIPESRFCWKCLLPRPREEKRKKGLIFFCVAVDTAGGILYSTSTFDAAG